MYISMPKFLFLVLVFIFFTFGPVFSQATRTANKTERRVLLVLHNQYRHEVGVDSLVWSDMLADYAQEWAEVLATKYNCDIRHRPKKGKYVQRFGENIYVMSGKKPKIEDILKNWAESEKKYYKGEPIGSVKSNKTTGHYTQIVWYSTKRVGCARAMCQKNRGTYIWVCNYDPPGNRVGQKPY